MKFLIIGGGKIGYYLLKTLKEREYNVALIERDDRISQSIAEDIDADIFCGDGTDIDVLKDAGIEEAEVVAAVTGLDEDNLIICQIAKYNFDIQRTIARVNNPKNIDMFKSLGVDKIVCSTAVIANLIEYEFDKDNFKIIQTFERGSMTLVEIHIEKNSDWCETFVKDLDIPEECVLTCILRDDKTVYLRGNTRIIENDNVLVLTNNTGLLELKKRFRNGS